MINFFQNVAVLFYLCNSCQIRSFRKNWCFVTVYLSAVNSSPYLAMSSHDNSEMLEKFPATTSIQPYSYSQISQPASQRWHQPATVRTRSKTMATPVPIRLYPSIHQQYREMIKQTSSQAIFIPGKGSSAFIEPKTSHLMRDINWAPQSEASHYSMTMVASVVRPQDPFSHERSGPTTLIDMQNPSNASKSSNEILKHQCIVCGRRFKRKTTLASHELIHSGGKPFQCKVCLSRFRQKSSLSGHLRTHFIDEAYECKKCGQRLSRRSYLRRHLQKVHKNFDEV